MPTLASGLRISSHQLGPTGSLGPAPTATQSCRYSHSGITLRRPKCFRGVQGDFGGCGRGHRATRRVLRHGATSLRVIVSRAGFGGPGVGAAARRLTGSREGGLCRVMPG